MTQHKSGATERPTLLTYDTTTSATTLALWQGEVLLHSEVSPTRSGEHTAHLAPMVDRAIRLLEGRERLDAVAISAGPGSYTGLRIASSLAKGLCHGLDIPLIGLSTLEIMAHAYALEMQRRGEQLADNTIICPMIDARRMEVYTASFDHQLNRKSPDSACVLGADEVFATDMNDRVYHFVGGGAAKVDGLWSDVHYRIETTLPPLATSMGQLAYNAYRSGDFVDLAYWTPNYLKEYVATIGKNKVLNR